MKKLLIAALTLCCGITVKAQNTDYRRCDTDQMWNEMISKDPSAKQRNDALRAAGKSFDYRAARMQHRSEERRVGKECRL